MDGSFDFLASLDPHHQRIGYLGCLALVSARCPERFESIIGRFHGLLFRNVYWGTPQFHSLWARIGPDDRKVEVAKRMLMHSGELPGHEIYRELEKLPEAKRKTFEEKIRERGGEENPWSVLASSSSQEPWAYNSELWIHDQEMPSTNGFEDPKPEFLDRTLALARWLEIILPTGELSEHGNLLKLLLLQAKLGSPDPNSFNPMSVHLRPGLLPYYLKLMLRGDGILHYVLETLLEHEQKGTTPQAKGPMNVLVEACDRLLLKDDAEVDLQDLGAYRVLAKFRDTISAEGKTTGENYLRPRIEILVDLGLVGSAKKAIPGLTEAGRKLAEGWGSIPDHAAFLGRLDSDFMADLNHANGGGRTPVTSEEEVLLYAAQAYPIVMRPIGFTPARSIATWASLDAWETGRVLEVEQVMKTLLEVAHGPWGNHILYSGGSRIDDEYLLKIKPSLTEAITASTGARIEKPLFQFIPDLSDDDGAGESFN